MLVPYYTPGTADTNDSRNMKVYEFVPPGGIPHGSSATFINH
jgi:hypothetical protein